MSKRLFDLVFALAGIVLLLPVFAVIALLVRLSGDGPVIFRQQRIGRHEKPFTMLKFRSMTAVQSDARLLTSASDNRITPTGRFLRKYKLDELPQLFNVVAGDMSLVGPRPEVPKYVEFYPPSAKAKVLSVRPGLTDFAALEFRNEEELLAAQDDPQDFYVSHILPRKIAYYEQYVDEQSIATDIGLIFRTLISVFADRPRR